jgi:hypothetical protein
MELPLPQPSPPPGRNNGARAGLSTLIERWSPADLAELFIIANLAFLAVDIFIAHSVNHFRRWQEWVPVAFSIVAPALLLIGILGRGLRPRTGGAWWLGVLIGVASILVGVTGMVLHLDSQFFAQRTLKSLVYTAPFAAPLAYTGLGLLLLLNRMVEGDSPEWAFWVGVLAVGGFVGNFVLSLADHAGVGLLEWAEWVPVVAAAFAVSFLLVPLVMRIGGRFLILCAVVMAIQVAVGVAGFGVHLARDLSGPAPSFSYRFLYGAPLFAPLLFPNLALLGGIGLWATAALTKQSLSGHETA